MKLLQFGRHILYTVLWLTLMLSVNYVGATDKENGQFAGEQIKAEQMQLALANYRKQADWSAKNVDIEVDLTGEKPAYSARLKLRLDGDSSDGPTLILGNSQSGMKMQSVRIVDGDQELPKYVVEMNIEAPIERKSTLALVRFNTPVVQGTEIELEINYEFVEEQWQVIHKPDFSYASWTTVWYPCPIADANNLLTISSLSVPGNISFLLKKKWNALSNGKLVEDKIIGQFKRQTWSAKNDVARSYAAGPFTVSSIPVGDIDVSMYMLNDDQKLVDEKANLIAKLISLLSDKFGPYPFDTFGLVEMPQGTTDVFGASSEQGFIVAESKYFTNDNLGFPLFSHEVGHAWWGNKFNCRGEGASLCSEGMAQIGTILGMEFLKGEQAMIDLMDASTDGYTPYQSARGFFSMWRNGDATPLSKVVDVRWIHRMMDSKGMWFWQMLRNEVGDEKFFNLLRSLASGELGTPTLTELEKYTSKLTNIDLAYFFDQWLNRADAPVIDMQWQAINPVAEDQERGGGVRETIIFGLYETAKNLEIKITQQQKLAYRLKIEVEIEFFYKPLIKKVLIVNELNETYNFEVEGMVKNVVLDPQHKILMWRPMYGPKPDLTK